MNKLTQFEMNACNDIFDYAILAMSECDSYSQACMTFKRIMRGMPLNYFVECITQLNAETDDKGFRTFMQHINDLGGVTTLEGVIDIMFTDTDGYRQDFVTSFRGFLQSLVVTD